MGRAYDTGARRFGAILAGGGGGGDFGGCWDRGRLDKFF